MRNLKSADIFKMSRIIVALDIKDEIKNTALSIDSLSEAVSIDRGFDLIYMLVEKATTEKAENLLFDFISGIAEMEVAELREMDADKFFELLENIASAETWKSFFTQVAKFVDRK